jgi:protein subunit release factor B
VDFLVSEVSLEDVKLGRHIVSLHKKEKGMCKPKIKIDLTPKRTNVDNKKEEMIIKRETLEERRERELQEHKATLDPSKILVGEGRRLLKDQPKETRADQKTHNKDVRQKSMQPDWEQGGFMVVAPKKNIFHRA